MPKKIHQTIVGEQPIPGGRRLTLEFREGGDTVPGVLLLPTNSVPAPAAVLLHGYSSRKEHMADSVGAALLRNGIASLAIDLPLHGTRGNPVQAQSLRNPLVVTGHWRTAIREAGLALHYLGARPETDRGRLAIVGYSLGAFLGVTVAARENSARALVLAAGGDLPSGTPFASLARAVVDPVRAVRDLAGTPLLMVHGKHDRTVRPEQAERLFTAAAEPKQIRWWDAGHILPAAAIDDAARWLAQTLAGPDAP